MIYLRIANKLCTFFWKDLSLYYEYVLVCEVNGEGQTGWKWQGSDSVRSNKETRVESGTEFELKQDDGVLVLANSSKKIKG